MAASSSSTTAIPSAVPPPASVVMVPPVPSVVLPRELFAIDASPLQLYLQRLQAFIDGKFIVVEQGMNATERRLHAQQRTLEEWEGLLIQRAHSNSTERVQRLLEANTQTLSSSSNANAIDPASSSFSTLLPNYVATSGAVSRGEIAAAIGTNSVSTSTAAATVSGNGNSSTTSQSASNVALIKLVEAMGNENSVLTENLRNALREIGNLKADQRKVEARQDHLRETQSKYYEEVDRLSMLLRPPNRHSPQQQQQQQHQQQQQLRPSSRPHFSSVLKGGKKGKGSDAPASPTAQEDAHERKGSPLPIVLMDSRRSSSSSSVNEAEASYESVPAEASSDLQLALQGPLLAELRRVLLRDIGERVSLARASLMTDMGEDLRSVRDLAEVRVTPQQVLDILAQQRAAEGSHDIGSLWRRLKDFEVQYVRQDDLAIALRYKVDTMLMPTKADNAQLTHLREEYDERCKRLEDRVAKLEEERNAMQYLLQEALDQFTPNTDGSKWVGRGNRRRRNGDRDDEDDDDDEDGEHASDEEMDGSSGAPRYSKHKLFPGGSQQQHHAHRSHAAASGAAAASHITADSDPRNLLADRQKPHLLNGSSKTARDRADVNAWQPNTNRASTIPTTTSKPGGDGGEIAGDRKAPRRGKRGGGGGGGGMNSNSKDTEEAFSDAPNIAGFGKPMTANQQAYAKHVVDRSSSSSQPPSRANFESLPPLPYEHKSSTR